MGRGLLAKGQTRETPRLPLANTPCAAVYRLRRYDRHKRINRRGVLCTGSYSAKHQRSMVRFSLSKFTPTLTILLSPASYWIA